MTETAEPLDLDGAADAEMFDSAQGDFRAGGAGMHSSHVPNATRSSSASNPSPATDDVQWYQSSGRPGELAWLADSFARSFSAAAGGLLRADICTRLAAVGETSRRLFTQAIEEPTCSFSLIPAGALPADSMAVTCLEFSPAIAMALVERLMGGAGNGSPAASGNSGGKFQAESETASTTPVPHPLTPTERRVLLHLANLVALSLSVARPGGKAGELRADLAPAGGSGDDRVVVATLELSLSGLVGTMRLCGCGRLAGSVHGNQHKRMSAAPLEVTATIEGLELDWADLAGLAEGDILATEVPVDGEITIRIGGIPKYAARLRIVDGQKVVTITRRLDGGRLR